MLVALVVLGISRRSRCRDYRAPLALLGLHRAVLARSADDCSCRIGFAPLSDELLVHIFRFLDNKALLRCGAVSWR